MDHEAAHDLYQTLKAYDSSAKAKQGLGFSTVEHADRPAERWRSDGSAVQSSSAQAEPGTRSERWRHEAEGRDAGAAHGQPDGGRYRPSQRSPDRTLRSSRVLSEQYHHDDKRRAGDRWLMDDERRADRRSSHSRDRDRDKSRDRDGDRHRDRDRDRHRDSNRHRNRHRDRDRDRDVGRRAHGSRDAEPWRDVERPRRPRSRSRDLARDVARSNHEDRPATRDHSSRYTEHAERDRHSSHGRQPSPHRRQTARSAPQQKPAEVDWQKLIDGYDQMTQAMQLRARMRYQLQQATTKASDDGQQWTRFQFDSGQPPDHDEAVEFDVKELPGNAAQVDASHEAAIFGAPPKQTASASDDDEDLPQVVELPEEANGTVDSMPTVVEEAAAPSHPKLSWRDRAAQLRAQREALAA